MLSVQSEYPSKRPKLAHETHMSLNPIHSLDNNNEPKLQEPREGPSVRSRSLSRETTELPDDSIWARQSASDDLKNVERSGSSAKDSFNWDKWTERWAAHHGIRYTPSDCLAGYSFLFVGHLRAIYRQTAMALVKKHGGKTVGSPLEGVNIAIVGIDGGERKMRMVNELKIRAVDEEEFIGLLPRQQHFKGSSLGLHLSRFEEQVRMSVSSGSSTASTPSLDHRLDAAEDESYAECLRAANRAMDRINTAFRKGLENCPDAEIKTVLVDLCKYSSDAHKHFAPMVLQRLRMEGIGRGLALKTKRVWEELKRRALEMSPDTCLDGLRKTKKVSKAPENEDDSIMGTATSNAGDYPVSQLGIDRLHQGHQTTNAEPISLLPTNPAQTAQKPAKEYSELSDETRSKFWCTQCRRGCAACMHAHRLIGKVVEDNMNMSLGDLMFAQHVLENWDSLGQDELGIERYFKRHNMQAQLTQDRASWRKSLEDIIQRRQENLSAEKIQGTMAVVNDYIATHATRIELFKAVRRSQEGGETVLRHEDQPSATPDLGFENERTRFNTRSQQGLSVSQKSSLRSRKRKMQRTSLREPFERESRVDPGLESLVELSDASVYSEDSLLESPPVSFSQTLINTPKGKLVKLTKQLLPYASPLILGQFIKTLCDGDDSTLQLAENFLLDTSQGAPMRRSDSSDASLSPPAQEGNLIDQIVSSVKPQTSGVSSDVTCEKCLRSFNSKSIRRDNECVFHSGQLMWKAGGQPVKKREIFSERSLETQTVYSCCNSNASAVGCQQGLHTSPKPPQQVYSHAPVREAIPLGSRSPSPWQSIELISTAPRDSKVTDTGVSGLQPRSSLVVDTKSSRTEHMAKSVSEASTESEEYLSIPDYTVPIPPVFGDNADILVAGARADLQAMTSNPFDLSMDPKANLLHVSEVELASRLRWSCALFLFRKRQLFKACLHAYQSNTALTANSFAKKIARGSHQKSSAFFKAYKSIGMLDHDKFTQWLGPQNKYADSPIVRTSSNEGQYATPQSATSDSSFNKLKKPTSGSSEYYSMLHARASNGTPLQFVRPVTNSTPIQPIAEPRTTPASTFTPVNAAIHKTPSKTSMESSNSAKQASSASPYRGGQPLPRTWEEAGEADKMMVRMKRQGRTWQQIWKMWESHHLRTMKDFHSLAVRYSNMKKKFSEEWERGAQEEAKMAL